MYDKHRYFVLAGLASCALLAGCASTTEGNASFAGGPAKAPSSKMPSPTSSSSSALPSSTPSDEASDIPSATASSDVPAEPPPSDRKSGSTDLEEDGVICQLVSDADLQKIWHQKPRLFPDSTGNGCTYKDADGDQIIISEYDNFVPSKQVAEDSQYKDGAKQIKTSVAGHPAIVLMQPGDFGDGYWYVSETKSIDGTGEVAALLNNDPKLQAIAKSMLEKIVPKYAH